MAAEPTLRRRPPSPQEPTMSLERLLALCKIDFPDEHPLPGALRLVVASLVAVVGSLALDALLVAAGTHLFPSTHGYEHFRFSSYAKLTVAGVFFACVGWPVVTWVSSAPRWVYLRAAVAVTLVLWLPDLWILAQGQPAEAVAVLAVMHVAIAVVTYNAMVRLAPPRAPAGRTAG